MSDVRRILEAAQQGDPTAAKELLPLLYGELRRLAAYKMAHEVPGQTLQPTALVHEAWLHLGGDAQPTWKNRAHFFGAAAEAMRRILVDRAREKKALKRGGDLDWIVMVLGAVVSTWQAVRATRARTAAVLEKQRADEQAAVATSVTKYLQQMFGAITPGPGKGRDYTVRQLLDDHAADLEKQLPSHPEVEATLSATLGKGYAILGERDKAAKHLGRALELRRKVFGDRHEKYAESLVDYAQPNANLPATLAEREKDLRRALAIYRARRLGGKPVIGALWVLEWNLSQQAHNGATAKWNEIDPLVKEIQTETGKFPGTQFFEMPSIYHLWADSKIALGQ